jgi:excinuclease ABC subunit C
VLDSMVKQLNLSAVPEKPGVYILKDNKEKIIYVGKAKNLKNRLSSYFQNSSHLDERKRSMVSRVENFSYIVTDNELEALILEANLIKQYKPRFNIILRDDKSYPYLRLATNEKWPYLEVVRGIKNDGALYFGPYTPSRAVRETISFVKKHFQIRDCKFDIIKPIRPCIQYQMGRCPAPCADKVSHEDYMKIVEEVRLFLSGKMSELIEYLERKMNYYADLLDFEQAALVRDKIRAIEKSTSRQKVVAPEFGDMDVIGYYKNKYEVNFKVFFIRNGFMTGSKDLFFKNVISVEKAEYLRDFLVQFYSKEIVPPPKILIDYLPNELHLTEKFLSEKRKGDVFINMPASDMEMDLIKMANENAYIMYNYRMRTGIDKVLYDIRERLSMQTLPKSIGAIDVSNLSGSEAVGSFIYWDDGEFAKDKYKRLKVKSVEGIDDYSMIKEVVERILVKIGEDMPDILMIDGGIGHLQIVNNVMNRLKEQGFSFHKEPFLIAIAKKPDRIFSLSHETPLNISDSEPSSLLLRRIRDEAHRFALSYHRNLRKKSVLISPLEKIKGIGKKRRLQLLKAFSSIDAIKNSTVDEICKIKGFNKNLAEYLLNELRRGR